ncbi:MAG: hypothetical protein HYV59_14230 [Planctomycetes bacterium]|nr:hypothetical protein [Planctomycetota bacterium]
MSIIKRCSAIVTCALLCMPSLSEAFEIHLKQAQIKEANEYGSKYVGKDIFSSEVVKNACFGDYPGGEGGIVLSKYVYTAVVSAMHAMKDKALTPEDIKEIEESATFKVVVVISDEDVKIPEDVQLVLVQGTNNILPQKTVFGVKRKDYKQSIDGIFQYDKINPGANTTILVKTRKIQKKYKIDFSDIK